MRWLISGVAGLFLLWSGYWFVGSRAVLSGVQTWVADAPKQGIPIKTGAITLAGYPSRFDLTILTPEYADPASGWSWSAPFVQVLTLSYTPWKVIVALPNDQTVARRDETIGIASERLRASINVLPNTTLGLDKVILEGDAVSLQSNQGWNGSAKHSVIALRKAASADASYEFGAQIDTITPDAGLVARLDGTSDLPPVIDSFTADVTAVMSAPLDRFAETTKPQVQSIDVKNILLKWGKLSLGAVGNIAPDERGFASGRIDIRVTGWRELVPLLVAAGAIKPTLAETAGNMLGALAASSPDPEVLALPLTMADGWMTLGPFPLGPAPALRPQPGL